MDEDMLIGIVANEISISSEPEAMKVQAVIARTNCIRAIQKGENLPEGLTKSEMMRLWGSENFTDYYSQLENCIESTKGIVITYQGEYIQADYHTASAGYTRNAQEIYANEDFPYLKSVESRSDITSPNFFKVIFYNTEEFLQTAQSFFPEDMQGKTASEILTAFGITKRDGADYVTEVTIGENTYSGEEIRLAFGWNSSCFYLREVDGDIRVVTKGLGHGLGLSICGAQALAKSGYSYKDILKYYYADIEFATTVSSE
ncbi:MAG: SpoIID/LytB domain-containing protein [Roseburia sp.]|nr:SpoIID/LytB domain-containing protein [Roseburia sp.]